MNGWKRSGRGDRVRYTSGFSGEEATVLRGLFTEVRQMLAGRAAVAPTDELSALTGIRTGPTSRPTDRVLARLLPDFTSEDNDLAGGLRSLHEPELIEAKDAAAETVLDTLPESGGRIELTTEQADAWLNALNDARLALGTALDVSEDMPEQLPEDDPRSQHLGVYHWLTYVQDSLVRVRVRSL
ncbi:DUF2017 domain-containing protein [Pseudonocardia phyllosphaerae]|uniref:DUF2017 domain-containing protein n=1 Tax=Pseudonocardia phyllosphaerae TaxID=3390502 RepID=UPI00397871BF